MKSAFQFVVALGMILFLSENQSAWAQANGDYQSATTGNWVDLTTWIRYDESSASWITPTAAQGYPGEKAGEGAVTIKSNHVVTIGTTGITTLQMGTVTIENLGRLYLTGTNKNVDFGIYTHRFIVQAGGSIYLYNKATLALPANASIQVGAGGLTGNGCNNSKRITVGGQLYAACSGAPGDIFTFSETMALGGSPYAVPSSNSPLCYNGTISLTGSYGGAIGTTPTYSWSVTAPGAASPTVYNTQNVTINNALTGTYTAVLTMTTELSGTLYSNSEPIEVIVNPLPTLGGVTQERTVCDNSAATILLSGLLPNTTFTATYSIAGGTAQNVTGLISNAEGTSSFMTGNLTTANNGQALAITAITVTDPASNCNQTFSTNNSVNLAIYTTGGGTWTGVINNDWSEAGNWCGGIVPTASTDVNIPADAPNPPIIYTTGAICQHITINSGASLSIPPGNTLEIKGNWTNSGQFDAGLLNPGETTVSFTGNSLQTITGSNSTVFSNLTINNAQGVVAYSNISVINVLDLASGNPSTGSSGTLSLIEGENIHTLTLGSLATVIGLGEVTGRITRTSINPGETYTFGHANTSIQFYDGVQADMPSQVSFIVRIGSPHSSKLDANIQRYYEIIKTGGTNPAVKFSLKLRYLENEFVGTDEDKLVFWDHHVPYAGTSPHEHGKTELNTSENWIRLAGHSISYLVENEYSGEITYVNDATTPPNQSKIWMISEKSASDFTWLGAASTNWQTTTNWSGSVVPTSSSNVVIPSGTPHNCVLSDNTSYDVKSITIEAGGTLVGGSSSTLHVYGGLDVDNGTASWENNGTFTPGASTIIFEDDNAAIAGSTEFYDLTIPSGKTLLLLNNSTTSVSNTLDLVGNLNAYYDGPTTFKYTGAGEQSVGYPVSGKYYHLEFSGGQKTLPVKSLQVLGDLTIGSSFRSDGSSIVMAGSSLQTIGGATPGTFNNLTINNAAGVTLGNNQTVDGILTLQNGILTTGDYTLTTTTNAGIQGGSTSSHVSGKLARQCSSAGVLVFPIGKEGTYHPMQVQYIALTETSTVTAEHFENTIPGSQPDNFYVQPNHYWLITESGGSNYTYHLTLNGDPYNPGTGAARILKGDGTTNTAIEANYNLSNFTIYNQTSFSYFAVGSECAAPVITSQPADLTACTGSGAVFAVTSDATGITYQWEVQTESEGVFSPITNDDTYAGATSNTLTITGVTSAMTGYSYRVVVTRDCGSSTTSDAATLTVSELPVITGLETHPEYCEGGGDMPLGYTSTTGTKYSIDFDAIAEAAGFVDVNDATILPPYELTFLPVTTPTTAVGTFSGTLFVTNDNGCDSEGYPITITIHPLPQGSLSGSVICTSGTGTLTWHATAGAGPYTIIYSDGATEYTANDVRSETPFSVSPNPSITTTYTLVEVIGTLCSRTSGFTGNSAVIYVGSFPYRTNYSGYWNIASNWEFTTDGTTWLTATTPPSGCDGVITIRTGQRMAASENTDVDNLTIQPGAALTIDPGCTFGAASATHTLQSDATSSASLINNGTLNGSVTYQRYLTGISGETLPWHLIASPVAGMVVTNFLQNAGNAIATNSGMYGLATFNEGFTDTGSAWSHYLEAQAANYTEAFTPGKGYEFLRTSNGVVSFTGTLHSAPTLALARTSGITPGWNLVGNPYPSPIQVRPVAGDSTATETFVGVNTEQLDASFQGVYYWDPASNNYLVSNQVEGPMVMAPGQAFFVRAKESPGSVSFPLTIRTHTAATFKSAELRPEVQLLARMGDYQVETKILFLPNATPDLDPGFDAGRFDMGETLALSTRLVQDNGVDFMLQCLPNEDLESLMIPVVLRAPAGTTVNFSLRATALPQGLKLYLEDRLLGRFTRLDEESSGYQVYLKSDSDGAGRFFLHTSHVDLEPDTRYTDLFTIIPMPDHGKICITGPVTLPATATVIDITGRVLTTTPLHHESYNEISFTTTQNGIYIVIIRTGNETIERKVGWR